MQRHLFIFVYLFCFVGEQIGFKVFVFGLAGQDIKYFVFLNLLSVLESSEFQSLEILAPFFHN